MCTSGEGFCPIGTDNGDFEGIFDGNNKRIDNLYINVENESRWSRSNKCIGLFGFAMDYKVENLWVTGSISSNNATVYAVGGIVAYSYGNRKKAEINNCNVDITFDLNTSTKINGFGGVVGFLSNTSVDNCNNYADVNLENQLVYCGAGVVGYCYSESPVSNCNNYGKISMIGECIGGVRANGYGNIDNCINYADVKTEGNTKWEIAGGVCGYNYGGDITNCSNLGDVTSKGSKTYMTLAGGICGDNSNSAGGKIENCFNSGNIYGGNTTYSYIGGIMGRRQCGATVIQNCYSKGNVTNGEVTSILKKGGIGGAVDISNVKNTYYLNTKDVGNGAINTVDYPENNNIGISNDFKNLEEFLSWSATNNIQ